MISCRTFTTEVMCDIGRWLTPTHMQTQSMITGVLLSWIESCIMRFVLKGVPSGLPCSCPNMGTPSEYASLPNERGVGVGGTETRTPRSSWCNVGCYPAPSARRTADAPAGNSRIIRSPDESSVLISSAEGELITPQMRSFNPPLTGSDQDCNTTTR